jgi:hypothetical protein
MKKMILALPLVFFIMLTASCYYETNFPEEGFGKAVVHNEAGSGKTITRIAIGSGYYNDRVSIPPGGKSSEYELEISLGGWGLVWRSYSVTITLDDNTTASRDISVYEDIVNNLYFDGTTLVERKGE